MRWQKKLRLIGDGEEANRRSAASSFAASSMAQGIEPRPPAAATASGSSPSCTPAIGAWMTGSSTPSREVIESTRVATRAGLQAGFEQRDQRRHRGFLVVAVD